MVTPPTHPDRVDASDADLLRAFARTRDDLAFGRLVARHAEAVRTIALRNTGNAHAAEDVAQAAFLVLSGRVGPATRSARRRGSVRPWLAKTCRYCAANWRRSEQRRRRREKVAAVPERVDPSQPGELSEAVAAAMSRLSSRDRRLIELHHLDEKPWPQVAAEMKLSPDAAKRAGARAVERLRGVLEGRGITTSSGVLLTAVTALMRPARANATPTTLSYELAKGTLLMLKLNTAVVSLLATGVLTLTGLGVAGAFFAAPATPAAPARPGTTALALAAATRPGTAAVAPSAAPAVTPASQTAADGSPAGAAEYRIGGFTAEEFRIIHGEPPSARLDAPLNFDEVPLTDVIDFMRSSTGVSIDFHQQALDVVGVDAGTPITFECKAGVTFENAMRRILLTVSVGSADVRLAWRYGTYVVTTAEGLEVLDKSVQDQAGELLLTPRP